MNRAGRGMKKRRGTGYSTRPERLEAAPSLKVCPSHATPENIADGANAPSGLKANLPHSSNAHVNDV